MKPWALVAAVASITSGCPPEVKNCGTVVVVLVDESESTKADRELRRTALDAISRGLSPGDRVIISPITDKSLSDFRFNIDERLPPTPPPMNLLDSTNDWRRRQKEHEGKVASARDRINSQLKEFQERPQIAQKTAIFDSLGLAAQFLAAENHRGTLVLLSDMLEDSGSVNFEQDSFRGNYFGNLLNRLGETGLIPDLQGAEIYLAGARATTPERAAAVANFWRRYFEAAKAPLKSGRYGRALVNFEVEHGCGSS